MRAVKVVDEWLEHQPQALKDQLADRAHRLGPQHAVPYWIDNYTDDVTCYSVSPELSANLAAEWDHLTASTRTKMCKIHKKQAGTVIDNIGARLLLTGGFGTLTQAKRQRAMNMCKLAIAGHLSRELYEANNGFIVHANDILDLKPGSMHGMWRPLKLPGSKQDDVILTGDAYDRYTEIIEQLCTKAGASFMCAVVEQLSSSTSWQAGLPDLHISSDACTDAPKPAIFCYAAGAFLLFELDEEWLRRTINVLEKAGTDLCLIVMSDVHPHARLVVEGDNIPAVAASLHRAKADDLDKQQRAAERSKKYQKAALRAWQEHIAGIANEVSDAGSRGRWHTLYTIAAALGIRLHELHLRHHPQAVAYLHDTLAVTTAGTCTHSNPPIFSCSVCNGTLMAIQYATDACPTCDNASGAQQHEGQQQRDHRQQRRQQQEQRATARRQARLSLNAPPPPLPPSPPHTPMHAAALEHGTANNGAGAQQPFAHAPQRPPAALAALDSMLFSLYSHDSFVLIIQGPEASTFLDWVWASNGCDLGEAFDCDDWYGTWSGDTAAAHHASSPAACGQRPAAHAASAPRRLS